jgi:hypothetical protein
MDVKSSFGYRIAGLQRIVTIISISGTAIKERDLKFWRR